MTQEKKNLINHISRLEGQLAAVKAEIQKEKPDCQKASATLLSAARSFAGLRQKFIEAFLLKYFVGSIAPKDKELFEKLTSLIKA